ncbi:MAG: exodeoxyribonuclease VII large subunit [Oscillospiraceae bacterium]
MDFITVSELNRYVGNKFRQDANLKNIAVRGEISGFKRYASSGHCYFSLKDRYSCVNAVMYSSDAQRLKFEVENGMQVTAYAAAGIYEKTGAYQIYVREMYPEGYGILYEKFMALKEKLESDGIFSEEHKKKLPLFPQKIAVVTSQSGAVFHDICRVVERRYPLCEIILFPTAVQGDVSDEICSALISADKSDCDLIIIARGGGSFEDLNVFNSENIARTIYDCSKPVISAVGHETDFTITDFSADVRASTPSVAGEIAVPDIESIREYISALTVKIQKSAEKILLEYEKSLDENEAKLKIYSPENMLEAYREKCISLQNRIDKAYESIVIQKENEFSKCLIRLDAANPLNIISKGFAIVSHNGKILSDFKKSEIGDEITVQLADDCIKARITEFQED